jgi:hypothetical protein
MLVFSLADISFSVFNFWVFHVALSILTMAVGSMYIFFAFPGQHFQEPGIRAHHHERYVFFFPAFI